MRALTFLITYLLKIEVQTHAVHSIAFNHFCTLWPCDLDLWPFDLKPYRLKDIRRSFPIVRVWRLWGHSFFSYAADRHIDTQTHSRGWTLYPATVIVVCNYYLYRLCRSAWVGFSSPSVCLFVCLSVCLFVCLFVRSITQKRMTPKCSNLV